MDHLFKQNVLTLFENLFSLNYPVVKKQCRFFCSLGIEGVPQKSKSHKSMHLTDRDHSLNVDFRRNVAYKKCRILPLIENLKFDWLRQRLHSAKLCSLTSLKFIIYILQVINSPRITFLNPFHLTFHGILHNDITTSVGNPRVILIDSLFHQSNMHDLCDLSTQ